MFRLLRFFLVGLLALAAVGIAAVGLPLLLAVAVVGIPVAVVGAVVGLPLLLLSLVAGAIGLGFAIVGGVIGLAVEALKFAVFIVLPIALLGWLAVRLLRPRSV